MRVGKHGVPYRSPNAGNSNKRFVLSIPKELNYQGETPDWIQELYLAPLKAGWKRLVVERNQNVAKPRTDVYYISPDNFKFRSRQEIGQYLLDKNIKEFEAGYNFSYKPRSLGGECARFEILKKASPISKPKKPLKNQVKADDSADSLGLIAKVETLAPKSEGEPKKKIPKIQTSTPAKRNVVEERVYCVCDSDVRGLMVKCDYSECPLQWYHLKCLKIASAPSGKWYCPICRGDDSTQLNIAYEQDFR